MGDEVGQREALIRIDQVEARVRDPGSRSAALTLAVPMSMPR